MALKKVFQNDIDFKERMFAKQIAVMKGQAWNVVEALKTPDHGPLELTRRTKVCVWDDLVDVPIAVPMRPSAELRRDIPARESTSMDEEDIASSAPTRRAKDGDLLGLGSAPSNLPHPGRFEISTPTSDEAMSPVAEQAPANSGPDLLAGPAQANRPSIQRGYMASYHGQGRGATVSIYEPSPRKHQHRYSFASPGSRRSSGSIAQQLYDGDDLEGDIGYAAAEGQMGYQRKVIVERLELVKTNPVFTWC
jgi:phosphatidylinositol 4-kinase type 2